MQVRYLKSDSTDVSAVLMNKKHSQGLWKAVSQLQIQSLFTIFMIKFISSPTVGINLANWGCFKMNEKSFGTAFLILLSLEPSISQEAITSQMAMLCLNKNSFFLLDRFRQSILKDCSKNLPETVLLMMIKNCPSLDFTEGKEPRIRIFDRSSYTGGIS